MIDDQAADCAFSWLLGQDIPLCKSGCNFGLDVDINSGPGSCLRHASIASCSTYKLRDNVTTVTQLGRS